VQTQVLPYLRQLRDGGVEISLLTFEPGLRQRWTEADLEAWRTRLAAEGIEWHCLAYHQRPTVPATLYDVVAGARFAGRLARRKPFDVFHARGHVAAAMGALAKRSHGGRLIFDIRGFLPEEYVDAGRWPKNGAIYRMVKRAEQRLVQAADGFVVLTEKAREIMFTGPTAVRSPEPPVEVIPCCVDVERFRAADAISRAEARAELGVEGRRVLVYVGALGGWYLTEELAELIAVACRRDPTVYPMILTQSDPEMILGPLERLGVARSQVLVQGVEPRAIPRYLKAADVALSLIKPCYSKLSSSPTKLAEYLASGLPVLCNAGIGDVDAVIEDDRVGVIFRELNAAGYERALSEIDALCGDPEVADRCRTAARERFDLGTVGGTRYRRLYARVTHTPVLKPAEVPA
jgi:glycosyltransferase involved in cell wall biosynthesis